MEPRYKISTRTIGTAAVVGLASFPIVVVTLNIVQLGHYDALTQPASQLALGKDGWLMTAAFCAFGLGTLLLAAVMRRTLPGNRWIPALLAVAGLLGFVAAAFPTDPTGVPATTHSLIHNAGGLATFMLYVTVVIMSGFAFRKTPDWELFSRATLVWGGLAIAAFLIMLILGGLHFFGVGQRIAIASWLTWLLMTAWRARSLGRYSGRATDSKVAMATVGAK